MNRSSMKVLKIIITLLAGQFFWVTTLYAEDMAAKLNHDWSNSNRAECKLDAPDYYCSGIIIHIFDNDSLRTLSRPFLKTSGNEPWMPNQAGIKKGSVSFSYLRQDISVDYPLYVADVLAGYIFEPIARLPANEIAKEYTLLCDYPEDAMSDTRPDKGCGFPSNSSYFSNLTDLSTCKSKGINTPEDYSKSITGIQNICSAAPDQPGFKMMLDTIKILRSIGYPLVWNELIIQEWSDKENKNVPLEAFFYEILDNVPDEKGKAAADQAAKLYHDATGIDVPVVGLDRKKLVFGEDGPFTNESPAKEY